MKPDELLHDGGEKDTHTVWATFTVVAETAKDSAHGGVGVAKAAAAEILRFVNWASRLSFAAQGREEAVFVDLIMSQRAYSSFNFQADLGYFSFALRS